MGNVSSITQCIGASFGRVRRKKVLHDDIQRLVDINIEFINKMDDDDVNVVSDEQAEADAEVVMYNVNEAFTND